MAIKALIIDDDPAMAELIRLTLNTAGIDALVAFDGQSGLAAVREENPDIIILDLMIPGQDGWEICHEVRSFSQVPIAVLSAIRDPALIASALDAGADDYMTKPVPGTELVAHINNLMRRANMQKNGNGHSPAQA